MKVLHKLEDFRLLPFFVVFSALVVNGQVKCAGGMAEVPETVSWPTTAAPQQG
jgi:hypothetical protein